MDLTQETLILGLVWYLVFVMSTTFHEAAHAWAALKLGDPTAYWQGQVSLNPLAHMQREPFGMLVVPWLSFLLLYKGQWMIGWASAPFDMTWALRYPRRAALMALAGPASNLLIVLGAGLLMRLGLAIGFLTRPAAADVMFTQVVSGGNHDWSYPVATLLSIVFMLNLVLLVFNLLPLPPLDGATALGLVLKPSWARNFQYWMRQPVWALVGLVVAANIFPWIFVPAVLVAFQSLYAGM